MDTEDEFGISVTVRNDGKLILHGKLILASEDATLRDVFDSVKKEETFVVEDSSPVCHAFIEEDGKRYNAALSDKLNLHVAFKRRFFTFNLLGKGISDDDVTVTTPLQVNAFQSLMSTRLERCLPKGKASGAGNSKTAKDRLFEDIVSLLKSHGASFSKDLCESEGRYVVQSLVNALWSIDGCHGTLDHAAKHKGTVPIPDEWRQFSGYNDYAAKKIAKPQLNCSYMEHTAGILFGLLQKPVARHHSFDGIRKSVGNLAQMFSKYAKHMQDDLQLTRARHAMPTVVRPIGKHGDVECRPPCQSGYILSKHEETLAGILSERMEYEPVYFDEAELFHDQFTHSQRYRFLATFQLPCKVNVHQYALGGNIGTLVFMWRVPAGQSADEVMNGNLKAVEKLRPHLPQYHTRHMKAAMADTCKNLSGITPCVRRLLYASLTGDCSASANPQLESRLRLVVLGDLPEVCADLRYLNSGQPAKYELFLQKLQERIADEVAEDERRRGVAHMSHFISHRDLYEETIKICPPDTPIPSLKWVELQFQPKTSQTASALRYTGKLSVRHVIQTRQLRSQHEDDHYCLSLFKMQRAMAVDFKQHSSFVCMDDKAKVPIGEPSQCMSTGVRNRPGVVAGDGSAVHALDHDQASRGSLTPSVVLQCAIPETVAGSFYQGTLNVTVKDTVLQQSTPFRHVAELAELLRCSPDPVPPLLFAYTDGGADHRTTFLSVQLSWVLIALELDLDMVIACRTAPGHSYVNPAERCMSTLNLGLQNCATARVALDDANEKAIRKCSGMSALRNLQPVVQAAWKNSVEPVKKLIECRFERLMYSHNAVEMHQPAISSSIATLLSHAMSIDPAITPREDLAQHDLKGKAKLEEFLASHCHRRNYSFQYRKCAKTSCEVCKPPRLDEEVFQSLTWLPNPVPDKNSPGHYQVYMQLKGQETSECHMPSRQSRVENKACLEEEQGCTNSFMTAQRVRSTIQCAECSKPRCPYSHLALSRGEEEHLAELKAAGMYTCGSPLCSDDHPLKSKVFVRIGLRCNDHIEVQLYSSNLPCSLCCHCA